ncbi:hypothetical protein AAG906_019233 [Vitis piasezkii]
MHVKETNSIKGIAHFVANKDGGWGLHIEGLSTMFGTMLSYVTLRLLGEGAFGVEGLTFDLLHTVLGAYEWSRNNPFPPEVWLCPYILLAHPSLSHCMTDVVSLSNGVFAHVIHIWKRFVGPITLTIISLRKKVYIVPYQEVDWNQARNQCAKEDLYYPHPLVQDILWASLHKVLEPILGHWPGNKLREKALCTVMQHVHYEDENTRYICIGPVNKVLNMLCCWIEDPNSEAFNQLWDTSFAVQAIISTNLGEEYGLTLRKVVLLLSKLPLKTYGVDILSGYRYGC